MKQFRVVVYLLGLSLGAAETPISYHEDIKPLLQRHCQACHQPANQQAGLLLTSYKGLVDGGRKGSAVMAGKPDESLLMSYMTGKIQPRMPVGSKPLTDAELDLFRRWIADGAKDDSPTDTQPLQSFTTYPAPPIITALAFSPDGKTVAVSGYREILLHDVERGLQARLPGSSERLHSLAFSPDGQTLVAAGGDPARFGELQIWDLSAKKQKHSVKVTNDSLTGAAVSPDGTRAIFGATDKSLRLYDVATGAEIKKMDHHEDWPTAAVFGIDGKRIVSVGRDRAAKLIDASSGSFIENVNLLKEPLNAIARHPKRDWILIGGQERVPYLYRMDRPRAMRIADDSTLIRKFERQDGPILAVAISPDGLHGAVASESGDVRIYDLETGARKAVCSGHEGGIYTLAFHPDSRQLATAGFDGTVRLYALDGKLLKSLIPVEVSKR